MSDDNWHTDPAPAWIAEPLLQPGERVVLWSGPRDGRLMEWLKGQIPFLFLATMLALPLLALAGFGLGKLLGGGGLFFALVLTLGFFFAMMDFFYRADKNDVFNVLTERHWLVIQSRTITQAFELDWMRRLLAAADAAGVASVLKDEHVLEPSKVRPLQPRHAEGLTEVEPILRMLRAFGQLQGR